VSQNFLRNAFIWSRCDLVENLASLLQTVLKPCSVAFFLGKAHARETKNHQKDNKVRAFGQNVISPKSRRFRIA
jgi:hypothetical protein